ncbi:MAG: branched-chain amino acid transport system permease protein [Alphaproteobacteria bacterium]|jgi:branched-chain amino acid transport system permease protein
MATSAAPSPGAKNNSLVDAVREAALTATIAAALMLPLIGIFTVSRGGALVVDTRFSALAIAVVLVFFGRLGLIYARGGRAMVSGAIGVGLAVAGWWGLFPGDLLTALAVGGGLLLVLRSAMVTSIGVRIVQAISSGVKMRPGRGPWLGAALVVLAIALPWLPFVDRRMLDLATLVLIYVMLGWGLNIVVGLAGLLDLGYVAFYAVGAYSFALLAHNFDFTFWTALPLAGLFAAFFGVLLGFPVLRLRGDYLAIVTLGFGEMVRVILINWVPVTGGPNGISGIPRPTLFGLSFQRRPPEGIESFHQFFDIPYSSTDRVTFLFYIVLVLALITNAFIQRIRKLPVGRAWEALREDEIACRALGLNPTNIKLSAFALGAMFGGFAGCVFAARQGFISPESFTFIESAIILAVVVLGGMGNQLGVAIAAILLIGLPEWFRELQEFRMLAFGALMVLIMAWRPRGLMSHREPSLRLHGGIPTS